jgi:hypothetical protein
MIVRVLEFKGMPGGFCYVLQIRIYPEKILKIGKKILEKIWKCGINVVSLYLWKI